MSDSVRLILQQSADNRSRSEGRPDMVDSGEIAAARRALGRTLAAYREAAGYSQHSLAPLTHYGRSTIANVETGRQNVPRAFWERCEQLLKAEGVLLQAYDRLAALIYKHQRETAQKSAWPHAEMSGYKSIFSDLFNRRLTASDYRPITAGETFYVDMAGNADRLLRLFLQLDATMGGNDLYEPMTRYVERLARAADEHPWPEMLRSLGQLSQMAGWLALDSNRHGAARQYFTTAIHTAHECDNLALAASALAYMSLQETYRNNPKRAEALATTAAHIAGEGASPLVRAMLETRLARAHAKLGNRTKCMAALEEAHRAFDRAGQVEEPLWISYVDTIEISAQSGACYLDLGLYSKAEGTLTTALNELKASRPERVRDHVHYLSRLAKCRLMCGDVEHACAIGMQAIDLVLAVGSSRVLERLSELDAALAPQRAQAARDFHESFRLVKQSY
jgi:tetratricopeptide (TPR) repeat protein